MTEEQRLALEKTINEFLNLTKEELEKIDNDPKYDNGLFTVIQEMSDAVQTSPEYQKFINK